MELPPRVISPVAAPWNPTRSRSGAGRRVTAGLGSAASCRTGPVQGPTRLRCSAATAVRLTGSQAIERAYVTSLTAVQSGGVVCSRLDLDKLTEGDLIGRLAFSVLPASPSENLHLSELAGGFSQGFQLLLAWHAVCFLIAVAFSGGKTAMHHVRSVVAPLGAALVFALTGLAHAGHVEPAKANKATFGLVNSYFRVTSRTPQLRGTRCRRVRRRCQTTPAS
jgi:hypothetical protein